MPAPGRPDSTYIPLQRPITTSSDNAARIPIEMYGRRISLADANIMNGRRNR